METNGKSPIEWVKAEGVDRNGHSLSWWKNKLAKWKGSFRPVITLIVTGYFSNGQQGERFEFLMEELTEAKAKAKEWTLSMDGSAIVSVRVEVPYEGTLRFDLGEWQFTGPKGYFVWQVGQDAVPIDRRGPFSDPEDAYRLAKDQARTSGAGKSFVVTWGEDPTKPDFEVIKAWKGWLAEVHTLSELPKLGSRLSEYQRNSSGNYYVWVLRAHSDEPTDEGPYGPFDRLTAEQMARIGATEGIHDRAVSRGRDPSARTFQIERRYRAKTGERIV